jgi:uncharacterized membrane protein
MRTKPAYQLVVLAYADEHRAAEVLATLQRLRTGSLLEPTDAVSVVRATDWHIVVHYGADLRTDEECTRRSWRRLIGSLFLAPGGSTDRASPERYRLDAPFVRDLNAVLPPGSSAVFVLVPRAALQPVLAEVARFGGRVLHTVIEQSFADGLTSPHRQPRNPDQGVKGFPDGSHKGAV